MGSANRLFSLFTHERGPAAFVRTIELGELREWPDLWKADPRLLPSIGDPEVESLIRIAPERFRYFAACDPRYPEVPLLSANPGIAMHAGTLPNTGIRDKLWQRLIVAELGHFPQPDFAAVHGNQIEAVNAPWLVRVSALDCRSVWRELRSANVPGAVVVVEGADAGFVAIGRADGVHLASRNPHVRERLSGTDRCVLSPTDWEEFVRGLSANAIPLGIMKAAFNPVADLGDALLDAPGSYVLKPRFGSNGVAVVRVVSRPDGNLVVETDCPDTSAYLEELPCNPALHGRDRVAAAATHRGRFLDRATAGLPEQTLDWSILEEEIPQDRTEGWLLEPRVLVQRMKDGSGERFVTLGASCKRIGTVVGASVARGFDEEALDVSLYRFLRDRVSGSDLGCRVAATQHELIAAADRLRAAVVPLIEARGAYVHQFGIDCRLCWNAARGRVEYPFLEFQFGIGRIDPAALGPTLLGYKTRPELTEMFGPDVD